MYINKWWGEYVGGTDDSLTLLDYFVKTAGMGYTLKQVFADLGLDRALAANDLKSDGGLQYAWHDDTGDRHADFDFAVDVVIDLAALTLESLTSGHVELQELDATRAPQHIIINAGKPELAQLCQALEDFKDAPDTYGIAEMMDAGELKELASVAGELAVLLRRFT